MSIRRPSCRPRVEGDREQEIRDATVEVLAEVGYDRLTMDAVAKAAQASKATLYRRWSTKAALVVDSLCSLKAGPETPVDTGSLRGDLLAAFGGEKGFVNHSLMAAFTSVLTALTTDEELATGFRERFIGPKLAVSREIYARAKTRGEIRPDLDLDLLEPALPGIILHRAIVLGDPPTPDLVARVIDQIILPAATAPAAVPTASATT
ncbi:TetR/AcrR family transcriptional regulator [Nocardioides zeae]|uniref:TetR/AcrR family transcriptional regulator n=1 Tax=Nocardioides imazamoxiresistens TaxID=3231893 RepID=A0ABU3PRG9_9ACTN|nr:TetR/AcrR family transcriptional regulator [Nocardioides zeae]MDT9591814.1 TetR/AcrR family transcriptional regulator [Nocardioides zeae]